MNLKASTGFFFLALTASLTGCGGSNFSDLEDFMLEAQESKGAGIEPLPAFVPYKSFIYSAAGLRSPFDAPVSVVLGDVSGQQADAPDPGRAREYLERFNFASLSMVGSVKDQNGVMWALVNDGEGAVHRVRESNYLGKNHGRVVLVSSTSLEVIETVTDGQGGWIERPRTLKLN